MKYFALAIGFAALRNAIPASAADQRFERCMANADGITSEMLSCIGRAQEDADRRLPGDLRLALQGLAPERRQVLARSQQAWVAYREAHCDFLADPDGGTAASLLTADCWLSLTTERLVFLDKLIERDTVLLR